MSSKSRGGRRPGAGRKAELDYLELVGIGGLIDRRITEARDAHFFQKVRNQFPDSDLDLHWRQLHAVPVKSRHVWSAELERSGLTVEDDDDPISQLVSDVRAEIGDQRYFVNPGKMPYGVRAKVLADTAKERGITVRMAKRCLETYRAFKKRFDEEDV